jgi:T4 gene Gp59 loader of gp41 DNA helicase
LEGMTAYRRYMALKLHFTTDYDFFKYGGKSRSISESSFEKRKDTFFFRRIERKYSDEELTNFFVSNFVHNGGKIWVGDLTSINAEKIYAEWKKTNESFTYLFVQDLKFIIEYDEDIPSMWEVRNSSHPQILKFLLGKKIRMETVLATNRILNFIPKWDAEIEEKFIYPDISRILHKYDPFLKFDNQEIRRIMRKELHNDSK